MRLDQYLAKNSPEYSRNRWQDLIKNGHVQINHKIILDCTYKIKEDDKITYDVPPLKEAIPKAQAIPLNIIYEDNDLLVINKPAGLVVHPAPGHSDETLVNAILHHCKDNLSGIGGVKRPGIIHRLDKDTSGLILVAKNDKAHHRLSLQFHDTMKRYYKALIQGIPSQTEGIIDAPIMRDPNDYTRMCVKEHHLAKLSQTLYKIDETFGHGTLRERYCLLTCRLKTGRTHQIRVHLKHIGHPIVGDKLYKGPIFSGLKRQFLHAYKLSFVHPTTKEKMKFKTELPKDLQNVIDLLRKKYST